VPGPEAGLPFGVGERGEGAWGTPGRRKLLSHWERWPERTNGGSTWAPTRLRREGQVIFNAFQAIWKNGQWIKLVRRHLILKYISQVWRKDVLAGTDQTSTPCNKGKRRVYQGAASRCVTLGGRAGFLKFIPTGGKRMYYCLPRA